MIAFTRPGRLPDPAAGTRPAPELARHDRVARARLGLPAGPALPGPASPQPRDAIAVLADILRRNGSLESAAQTRARSLAGADHLATLNAIWQGETTPVAAERYRQLVLAELPGRERDLIRMLETLTGETVTLQPAA